MVMSLIYSQYWEEKKKTGERERQREREKLQVIARIGHIGQTVFRLNGSSLLQFKRYGMQ
jgi:hypothetical protein